MQSTKDIIMLLKQVKAEKNLSFDKILAMMEDNGQYLSKSTLSRVFAEGSEDSSFRYETSGRSQMFCLILSILKWMTPLIPRHTRVF